MTNLGADASKHGDFHKAKEWWRSAAEGGDANAKYKLGVVAEQDGDLAQAINWWRSAAAAGDSQAKAALRDVGDFGV